LGKIAVRILDPVSSVKKAISDKISEIYPQYIQLKDVNQFRLREKLNDKLVQVYHNDKILSTYSMHDDKEISI
tara:strand:- start:256 stop:474 length:219 start_codon:yes stop_codon:yes gene_type:complete